MSYYPLNFRLALIIFAALLCIGRYTNPPAGNTGAPGESTCANGSCHSSGTANHNVITSLSGLPNILNTGESYTITLDAVFTGTLPSNPRLGYQLTILDENNTKIGELNSASPSSRVRDSGDRSYAEHSPGLESSNASWNIEFTTPVISSSSKIRVFAAVVAANGNSMRSGDIVKTLTMTSDLDNSTDPLSASLVKINDVSCFDGTNGSARVDATGGPSGNYEYTWDNGETTREATMLSAGLHLVTIEDGSELITESIIIAQPEALSANTLSFGNPTCHNIINGMLAITGEGGVKPYSYSWETGQKDSSLVNISGGAYKCTITDFNDCTFIYDTVVVSPLPISIDFEIDSLLCADGNNGALRSGPSGGSGFYSYLWSNDSTTTGINNLRRGVYSLTVIDNNGCMGVDSALVNSPSPIMSNLISVPISCYNSSDGSLEINPTGGIAPYQVQWNTGDDMLKLDQLSSGSYSCNIRDANDCLVNLSKDLLAPDSMTVDFINAINGCQENLVSGHYTTTIIGGTPPYLFEWSNGSRDSLNRDLSISNNPVGLTVTDSRSCMQEFAWDVPVLDSFLVSVSVINESAPFRSDGKLELNQLVGIEDIANFDWSTGSQDSVISGLPPGEYTLSFSDIAGCASSRSYSILPFDCKLEVDFTISQPLCHNECSGIISFDIFNEVGPYEVAFEGLNTTERYFDSICSGFYRVQIKDSLNCEVLNIVELNNPDALFLQIDSIRSDKGQGGAIFCSGFGGTGDLRMIIKNTSNSFEQEGDADFDFYNIPSDHYIVSLIDSNDCVKNSIELHVPLVSDINESLENIVSIFPIPTKDKLSLQFASDLKFELQLMDFTGRILQEIASTSSRTELTLSSYAPGVYWLRIKNGSNEIIKKVVKY